MVIVHAPAGVVLLATALQRYFFGRLHPWQALTLLAVALLPIYPDLRLTLAGLASTVVVLGRQATCPPAQVFWARKQMVRNKRN